MNRIPKIGDRVYVKYPYYGGRLESVPVTIAKISGQYCYFTLDKDAPEDLKRGWYDGHNFDKRSIMSYLDEPITMELGYDIY